MTKDDALRMMLGPFKAWRDVPGNEDVAEELTKIITAVEKVLAQDKALQALHSENERLGLYKDAYAEPDLIARLRDTASKGVSVWGDLMLEAAKEIETLMAERECYASAMDRMLAQPEQEPVAWKCVCGANLYIDENGVPTSKGEA